METKNWFDEDVAATYDEDTAEMSTPAAMEPQLDLLAELAGGGPVLELAVGTGRVALPLAARGLSVVGIELSAAMVARLRAKPGGDEASLPVVVGDMTTAKAPGAGSFTLAYLVFNSLMNLTTQEAQVACFANVASHLAPGGFFVVEMAVPSLRRLPAGERFVVFDHDEEHVGIDEYDVATQRQWSHHITFRPDGSVSRQSPPFRYAWPAELDLMAQLAGMRLHERWADWNRSPFTSESSSHVSVWQKPLAASVLQ
jgi:SAM-dependent methyltransferase